ncbi:WecB/TagA/CpsF family glycosyltransferase [Corallococcus exiguus]|uniref:WecB/TagA/CpsF family glycosyltransferase n=1 Tax=Corallococcus exiguus TaxID=83462 RepID=UPI001A8C374E|nr:WecB/TagA/CpsF family glycosyltransferase [Corallococcus exiguus]MBN8471345.1 WecB/TagA/CpsF family glycosyltransferase [Corallococcus exiguus]
MKAPLPRAPLRDVLRGRAPLVGARFNEVLPRGYLSPVEARWLLGLPYGDLAAEEARYLQGRTPATDFGVMLRTSVARALAPPESAQPEVRPFIVSARVDNLTLEQAVEQLFTQGQGGRAKLVSIVHPHALNLAARDVALARALAEADMVLPDGIGIRVGAALLGVAMRHNLNGTDLLPLLCKHAPARGWPVVLVGAAPGVAEACAENLRRAHPGLELPIVSHGFLTAAGSRALAESISRLGPCLVLVGMGSPRQELWAREYLSGASQAVILTVGGLFDFYSGRIQRAPIAWRELGLEWMYRLLQEPRRMAVRYLLGNPLFLLRILWQKLR